MIDYDALFESLKRDAEVIRDAQPTTDEATRKTLEWLADMNGENNE